MLYSGGEGDERGGDETEVKGGTQEAIKRARAGLTSDRITLNFRGTLKNASKNTAEHRLHRLSFSHSSSHPLHQRTRSTLLALLSLASLHVIISTSTTRTNRAKTFFLH